MDIEELKSKFGTQGKPAIAVSPNSEIMSDNNVSVDDLKAKFGTKGSPAVPAPVLQQIQESYYPKPNQPITGAGVRRAPYVEDIQNAPSYLKNKTVENFNDASKQIGQGVGQLISNQPASGVGNVGMGLVRLPLAPVSAVVQGVEKFGNKFGSDIGTKGTEVLTSGLPIGGAVKVTSANLIPSSKAIDKIASTLTPEALAEGIQRMRDNPRLSPADVFPNVKSMSQGLAIEVGPSQSVLTKAVEARRGTARDAVGNVINEAMGEPVDVLNKINTMKQNLRTIGEKKINPIVEKSKPAEITNIIKKIDDAIADNPIGAATLKAIKEGRDIGSPSLSPTQMRLLSLRQELRGDWKDNSKMFLDVQGEQGLHRIQKDLRAEAQTLLDSQGSDKLLGGKLMSIRNDIVSAIDKQHGGSYKQALEKYRDEYHVQDAFEKGQDILRNRPTKYEDRPELWANWIKNASKEEIEAAREGARLALDQQINGMRNAVGMKGTEIAQTDFNAKKLEMLFSKKEIQTMFNRLRDERDMATTNKNILEGPETAFRLAGQEAIKPRPPYKPNLSLAIPAAVELASMAMTGGVPTGASLPIAAYQYGRIGVNKIGQVMDKATSRELGKLALATGEQREALIEALSNKLPPAKLTASNKFKIINDLQMQKLKTLLPIAKP